MRGMLSNAGAGMLVLWLTLLVAGGYGWVANIITLTHCTLTPLTVMVVLRFVGIFVAPLGAILGYIR